MSPVSGRSKTIWAILALVAMGCFIAAWIIYMKYNIRSSEQGAPTTPSQTQRSNP